MKLSTRVLVTISLTGLALFGTLSAAWTGLQLRSSEELEAREIRRELARAQDALQAQARTLEAGLSAATTRDDAWRFMETGQQDYLDENLAGPGALQRMGLHVAAYVTPGGRVVHAEAIATDAGSPRYVGLPERFLEHLTAAAPLVHLTTPDSRVSGLIDLPQGPLLVAARPIVHSTGQGPIRGTLIWGHFINPPELVSALSHSPLSLEIRSLEDPGLPADMAGMRSQLEAMEPAMGRAEAMERAEAPVAILPGGRVAAYGLIQDIYHQPTLLVRVTEPRTVAVLKQRTLNLGLILLAFTALGLMGVQALIGRRLVFDPLARLRAQLEQLGQTGDHTARVPESGHDELSSLARPFNGLLERLERSMTDLRQREADLHLEARFRALVDTSPVTVLIARQGRVTFVNPAGVKLLGASDRKALLGTEISELFSECGVSTSAPDSDLDLVTRLECRLRRLDGTLIDVDMAGSSIEHEGGPAWQFVIQDITGRKRVEERLHYLAHHDGLTGLPNRLFFNQILEKSLAWARRSCEMVAIIVLDLDRFKSINDTVGHAGGDQLLVEVARRLRSGIRASDTVVRMGGDEFFFICPHITESLPIRFIAHRILEMFKDPVLIDGYEFVVTPSLGIAVYPSDGDSVEMLTRSADAAMYRAKSTGGNNYHLFDAAMGRAVELRRRLEVDLRRALAMHELFLCYQPQVEVATGRIVGAEALLRWRHPQLGLISPAEFIPVAEENGMIIPITEWVMRTACKQVMAWIEAGMDPIRISVNLSARHFNHPHHLMLVQYTADLLAELKMPAKWLELEITESAAMHNLDNTAVVLRRLHALGVLLSIDDFGTGHASLVYLKKFPIHALKIDQAFIRDLTVSADSRAIVEAIVAMSHALNVKVVAEGVETGDQLELLQARGADLVQGYLYSRPLPAEEFARLMAGWVKRLAAPRENERYVSASALM